MIKALAAIAIAFTLCGEVEAKPARVFVFYGQGGIVTSPGMLDLANRIKTLDRQSVVTTHNWDDYGSAVTAIRKLPPDMPVVLIGYSLGAGVTTYVANSLPKRRIDLIVAYDPSIWQTQLPAGPNVKRLLLYRNGGFDLWGHARIPGAMVETTEVVMFHLAVQFDERLHAMTLAAVRKVMGKDTAPLIGW
jgi:pimeloyl-ACP methyl ester carboxylesterase